jgi:hypothetical protein
MALIASCGSIDRENGRVKGETAPFCPIKIERKPGQSGAGAAEWTACAIGFATHLWEGHTRNGGMVETESKTLWSRK